MRQENPLRKKSTHVKYKPMHHRTMLTSISNYNGYNTT